MLAFTCTLCHSIVAEEVRAALLGPDLIANAAAALAPAPVIVGVWWLLTGSRNAR